jgi:hypothetical protein
LKKEVLALRGKFGDHAPLHLGKYEAVSEGMDLSEDKDTRNDRESEIPFEDYGVPFNQKMRRMDCTAHANSTIISVCGKNEREKEKRLLESWIKQEAQKHF